METLLKLLFFKFMNLFGMFACGSVASLGAQSDEDVSVCSAQLPPLTNPDYCVCNLDTQENGSMITQFPASKHTRENRGKNHAPPPSISMFFRVYIKYYNYQNIKIAQMKEANAQNSYRSCFKILKKQVYFSFLSRIQIDDKTTSFTFLNLGTFLSIVSHSIQCFSKKFLVATVCSSIHIFSVFLQKMQTFFI